jgi:hypothetical protein
MPEHDAERQAAAAVARTLLPHIDVPAVRRAFEQTLSAAERRHLDQLRRRYGEHAVTGLYKTRVFEWAADECPPMCDCGGDDRPRPQVTVTAEEET